jgi:hypothetical protein
MRIIYGGRQRRNRPKRLKFVTMLSGLRTRWFLALIASQFRRLPFPAARYWLSGPVQTPDSLSPKSRVSADCGLRLRAVRSGVAFRESWRERERHLTRYALVLVGLYPSARCGLLCLVSQSEVVGRLGYCMRPQQSLCVRSAALDEVIQVDN